MRLSWALLTEAFRAEAWAILLDHFMVKNPLPISRQLLTIDY
jgi:hypothetical protein